MAQIRRLAAIMFTDIVGYTALMGQDEEKAFTLLKKNRDIQKPVIEQYQGRWIKELGDGVMASFESVSDAAMAAVKIQEACLAANEFQLRIGIHLGEVVFENEDVFGDGVNLAARIQAHAPVGGIWVSESVHHNLINKNDIQTEFVKEVEFKNVKQPIRIYRIVTASEVAPPQMPALPSKPFRIHPVSGVAGLLLIGILSYFVYTLVYKKTGTDSNRFPEKSIAVLPFNDMSPGKDQEYLGDGLAEEIITVLSGIKELKVIGRTSSFQFKGEKIDLREVGNKLNVGSILEGSVRKYGNQIRITAQLIDVKDNAHLWSQQYDREMVDIFKIQDEIATSIAERLKITLSATENQRLKKTETTPAAYTLYLKGLHAYREAKYEQSIDYNLQVIEIDPAYPLAYAYIALAKAWIINRTRDFSNSAAINEVKQYARKSIDLGPQVAEGYSALALLAWSVERNFSKAREYFDQSLRLNSVDALIINRYAYFLLWMAEFDQAAKLASRAIIIDPVDYNSYVILSHIYQFTGKLQEAGQILQESQKLFPDQAWIGPLIIRNTFLTGQYGQVVHSCDSIREKEGELNDLLLALESISLYKLNRVAEGQRVLKQLQGQSFIPAQSPDYYTALVFAARSQPDSSFSWLSRSLEKLEPGLRFFKIEPIFKAFEDMPAYRNFYQAYGFDNY